jgi:hypothetical protein
MLLLKGKPTGQLEGATIKALTSFSFWFLAKQQGLGLWNIGMME